MIRNYNAYLILALFGHDGHCITIANVSLQFKRYSFNINTIFNHSQRSHISQCSISTITIHKHHHYSSYSNITQYYSNFSVYFTFELDLIIWRGSNHICSECLFDKMAFMVDLRIDIKTKKMLNIAPSQKSCVI